MTERERLIELLMQGDIAAAKQGVFNCCMCKREAEILADFLLENGVTVLPAKVGDTVYIKNEPHDILAMYIEGNEISYYDINCFAKEVIGNIHDNPELLGGENNGINR